MHVLAGRSYWLHNPEGSRALLVLLREYRVLGGKLEGSWVEVHSVGFLLFPFLLELPPALLEVLQHQILSRQLASKYYIGRAGAAVPGSGS